MARRRTEHVLLFSVDGLRPEIYRDERWPAPVLQQLARGGAFALAVRSVFPALTYPAHATLVTGVLPARHGIVHNEEFGPAPNRTGGSGMRARSECRRFGKRSVHAVGRRRPSRGL